MQLHSHLSQPQTLHAAECLPRHPPEAPSALSWPWLAHAARQHLRSQSSCLQSWGAAQSQQCWLQKCHTLVYHAKRSPSEAQAMPECCLCV